MLIYWIMAKILHFIKHLDISADGGSDITISMLDTEGKKEGRDRGENEGGR
jgi:hypothetical protein